MITVLALIAFGGVMYLCGSIDRELREDNDRG